MGMWRNGRREGLKIPWQQYREGSTPSIPTTLLKYWRVCAHSSTGQSVWLRTKRLGVQVLLGAPKLKNRDVAQLGRVLDLGSRCHRFESCHPDHFYSLAHGEVAQLARAIGSYPVGRGFESHPRYHFWTLSSDGQSFRLITGWSQVRVLQGPPLINIYKLQEYPSG